MHNPQKEPLPPFGTCHKQYKSTFQTVLHKLNIDKPFILTANFIDDICPHAYDQQKCIFKPLYATKMTALYFFSGNIHSYYKRFFTCTTHSNKKRFVPDHENIKWNCGSKEFFYLQDGGENGVCRCFIINKTIVGVDIAEQLYTMKTAYMKDYVESLKTQIINKFESHLLMHYQPPTNNHNNDNSSSTKIIRQFATQMTSYISGMSVNFLTSVTFTIIVHHVVPIWQELLCMILQIGDTIITLDSMYKYFNKLSGSGMYYICIPHILYLYE